MGNCYTDPRLTREDVVMNLRGRNTPVTVVPEIEVTAERLREAFEALPPGGILAIHGYRHNDNQPVVMRAISAVFPLLEVMILPPDVAVVRKEAA